jgi:hypothetical protein
MGLDLMKRIGLKIDFTTGNIFIGLTTMLLVLSKSWEASHKIQKGKCRARIRLLLVKEPYQFCEILTMHIKICGES